MGASLSIGVSVGSMDIVNNRTPLTVSIYVTATGSTYNMVDYGAVSLWGSFSASGKSRFAKGTTTTLLTTTQYVYHNSDGTGSYSFGASYNTNVSPGTITAYASGSLPTIPRVSDISVASSSVTIGGSQTITTSKKSSSFTDKITCKCGSASLTATSGTAFTIPTAWLQQFPSASSITATAVVETFNGSTSIGTKSTTFTIKANDYSDKLTITHAPITDSATKPSAFNGYFVQGISKPRVQSTASGYQGSTISSIVTTIDGIGYTGSDISTTYALQNSGTISVNTKITDSRGVSKTLTDSISVIPYSPPSIATSIAVSGTKATLSLKGAISPVNNGSADLNTKACAITIATSDTSETRTHTLSGYTFDDTEVFTIDPSITYTLTTTISDLVYTGSSAVVSVVKTGIILMSRHAGGDGVTFGAEASTSGVVLSSGWDIKIEDADLQTSLVAVLGSSIVV